MSFLVCLVLLGCVAYWALVEAAAQLPEAGVWWCTPCQRWVVPIRGSQIGARCPNCGSGRIRPPRQGEDTRP